MSTVQNPTDQIPPPPPPPPPPFIPSEIIAVILSFLPVKIITRFRCVSKTWKNLISDPSFIKIHLQKSSSLNPNFILTPFLHEYPLSSIVSLPVSRLLHNDPSITLSANTYPNFLNNDEKFSVVNSCNGLLCLLSFWNSNKRVNFSFRIWNPATGTISEKLGFLRENFPRPPGGIKFTFGCDSLTGIYKIMCVHSFRIEDVWKSTLRVFNVGDDNGDNGDCWRYISSPVLLGSGGVHLNGNIVWSTLSEDLNILGGTINIKRVGVAPHVDFFKIVSLDLSTEKFREILHPKDFEEMPCGKTNLRVLLDCLCLCHDFRKTEFVIWQMKEFGVQDSWTKIFRIRFIDLQMPNIEVDNLDHSPLVPLYISKDGDTVILSSKEVDKAIIYNKRDNSVVRTAISNDIYWFYANDYVESLVPTPWKSGDIEAMKDEDDDDDDDVGGGFRFFRVFLDEDDDGGGGGDGDGDGGGDDDDGGGGGDDDDDDVDDDDEVGGGGGFIFIGVFHGGQNRD